MGEGRPIRGPKAGAGPGDHVLPADRTGSQSRLAPPPQVPQAKPLLLLDSQELHRRNRLRVFVNLKLVPVARTSGLHWPTTAAKDLAAGFGFAVAPSACESWPRGGVLGVLGARGDSSLHFFHGACCGAVLGLVSEASPGRGHAAWPPDAEGRPAPPAPVARPPPAPEP